MQTEETYDESRPIAIDTFIDQLRPYLRSIALTLVAIALLYGIVAITLFVTSGTDHMTSQPFRLDFQGAGDGRYPNSMKFTPVDIISSPLLIDVYRSNHLDAYISFGDFSRSLTVAEFNRAYEALAAGYQARLADARLGAVDRERIQ
ncbi:MAG: hypothetical protein ABI837_07615, partial [Acidobacteriota bacterium]